MKTGTHTQVPHVFEETEAAADFRFLFSSLGSRSMTCPSDLLRQISLKSFA